jgi:hypothetical protein
LTPPWPLHAPRSLAPEYHVPSSHFAVVPAGASAGACACAALATVNAQVVAIDTSSVFTMFSVKLY